MGFPFVFLLYLASDNPTERQSFHFKREIFCSKTKRNRTFRMQRICPLVFVGKWNFNRVCHFAVHFSKASIVSHRCFELSYKIKYDATWKEHSNFISNRKFSHSNEHKSPLGKWRQEVFCARPFKDNLNNGHCYISTTELSPHWVDYMFLCQKWFEKCVQTWRRGT